MANEKRLIDANALWAYVKTTHISAATRTTIMCLLDIAPTVDAVEVVHGHWVYSGEPDDDRNIQANCSVCGAGDKHATSMIGHVPYCWKCGAKMDGGLDETRKEAHCGAAEADHAAGPGLARLAGGAG